MVGISAANCTVETSRRLRGIVINFPGLMNNLEG